MNSANDTTIVFIGAFALVLGIVIVVNIARYHVRKLKSEERMAAIAKGIPLPPEIEMTDQLSAAEARARQARGLRTGGIVLVAIGVGMGLFSVCLTWIIHEHNALVAAAAGIIPFAIGVGLLIDYALRVRPALPEPSQPLGRIEGNM
ncbi:MAG: DUF6249 domain-containing protein [Acidobacteriaceae bacterium]